MRWPVALLCFVLPPENTQAFSNLRFRVTKLHNLGMPYLPSSSNRSTRPERARFPDITPVVLRFNDGIRASGKLKVVSITGGLLAVSRPMTQGATAKLMFLTRAGSVLGVAQLLTPLSWDQQPFRFVSLHHDDECRLQAAIQACREQERRENKQLQRSRELMENFRAW
jgi:hypothetical protein